MSQEVVPFRLFHINTEEFATFPEFLDDETDVNIHTGLSFAVDEEGIAIKCILRVLFETNQKIFMLIQASCEFEIEVNTWNLWLNPKKNALTIPKGFATHLAILTAGTTRGILHSKTENSELNRFFLPTININEFVHENVKIEFNIS